MNLSEKYDEFYRKVPSRESMSDVPRNRWPRNRIEAIVAHSGTGERVLDIGCGGGHLLFQLRDRYKFLIGLEYSALRLEQAKINLSDLPFNGFVGSAESMEDIPTASIDCIVSADTIEHIPDVYRALAECYRVTKPGGKIVINTPNIAFIKKRAWLLFGRFPSTSQRNEGLGSDLLFDGGHLHYLTFRSLGGLLKRAGYSLQEKIGYGRLGYFHQIWPELLSGGAQWIAVKR